MGMPKRKAIHTLMLAAHAMLVAAATPFARVFMETVTVEALEDRLIELNTSMQTLQARADGENRDMTADEIQMFDGYVTEFASIEGQIERRKQMEAMNERATRGTGRQTEPPVVNNEENQEENNGGGGQQQQRAARQTRAGQAAAQRRELGRTRPAVEEDRKGGFRNLGEFAQTVRKALLPGATADPRLTVLNATLTGSVSTEGSGPDGGFAVPPDFRTTIMEKIAAEDSLLRRTDQLVSSSNTIVIPVDEVPPWDTVNGIQAYWLGETEQKTKSKVQLDNVSIKLNKLAALVPVSDELLEDAPALAAYIRRKAPGKFDFKITDAIIRGTGVGMPLGLLNSPAKVTIAKESGQAAGTINFTNIIKMWARLYAGNRRNAIWLINQDIEPALMTMSFPGTGTAVPAYLPPGGLSASPYGTLLGRPVIPVESTSTLGTEGDIILTDLSAYMTAQKISGIRSDVSIHLYFDYDVTTFRFVMRVAGQPWWNKTVSPAQGSNVRGSIITLADRL